MKELKTIVITVLATLGLVVVGAYVMWEIQKRAEYGTFEGLLKGASAQVATTSAVNEASIKGEEYFDTYVNASYVARALLKLEVTKLPETSVNLPSVQQRHRLDAWGHLFCLRKIGERIVVVSPGSRAVTFPGCERLFTNPDDIPYLEPGLLYEYPSGMLVLVIDSEAD